MGPSEPMQPPLASPGPKPEPRGLYSNAIDDFEGLPEAGWGPGTVGLGVFALIFAQLTLTLIVSAFYSDLLEPEGAKVNQLILGLSFAGTAIGFALYESDGRLRDALVRLGITPIILRLGVIAVLGWLAYIAFSIPVAQFLQPEQQDVAEALGTNKSSVASIIASGLLIIGVAPIAEELFFRGFVYSGLRRALSIWPAIVISGVVFGSIHLIGGNVGVAVLISAFGIVLAYLYERTGSIWTPIVAHMINNSIAFTLLLNDVV